MLAGTGCMEGFPSYSSVPPVPEEPCRVLLKFPSSQVQKSNLLLPVGCMFRKASTQMHSVPSAGLLQNPKL